MIIRDAEEPDVPAIVAPYAEDDPRHRLVAEDDGRVVATRQLSFLPNQVRRAEDRC